MANGRKSLPDNYLEKGFERLGVLREFQRGKKRRDLTFVVDDPELYALAKAWPKLSSQVRAVIMSVFELSRNDESQP